MMSRITPEHLARGAIVYVRQSSMHQVRHNTGSQEWQYDLQARARSPGWQEVTVIDEDLGLSGGGTVRPGFQRLLEAVCRNEVGVILAVDATRLARNGREWHTLLEFCGIVGCLLADEQSVYDPRIPSDRMILGMQGAISELEVANFRRRAREGIRRKAERGELVMNVAIGYRRVGKDGIEMDPDLRVREAVALVFRKFAIMRSIRQVHIWLLREGIELPARPPGQDRTCWRLPGYRQVQAILTNPVYAGAYAFGRRESRISIRNGRKHISRHMLDREEWPVLIRDHHEGYITWEEYERNQRVISDNVSKFMPRGARGPVRSGKTLLTGLLRCGHCGRKLTVTYSGTKGRVLRYICASGTINHGEKNCISFSGWPVDQAAGGEIIRVLDPVATEAALRAVEEDSQASSDVVRQTELALERGRYEADRAWRQYDAVDPANRQVAGELEARWNARLIEVQDLEAALERARDAARATRMSAEERDACLELGANLAVAWNHENVTPEVRKTILRAAIEEIVVYAEDSRIRMLFHWRGGDHTEIHVAKRRTGQHRYTTDAETVTLITELARLMPDASIASLLNRLGRRTGKGNTWREANVQDFRYKRKIPVYRKGEREERGELTLSEAAEILGVSPPTALRMIKARRLPARQVCKVAPWVIPAKTLASAKHSPPPDPSQPSIVDQTGQEKAPSSQNPDRKSQ